MAGCTIDDNITNTSPSAAESLLLNNALEGALGNVDFDFFAGRNVYYDDSNLDAINKGWISHRVRESLASRGAHLQADRNDADVIVEASVGTYGTDSKVRSTGVNNTYSLPNATINQRGDQYGSAVLSLFAIDRESGDLLWRSGPHRCDSHLRTRYYFGVGPFYQGTIRHPAETFEPFRDQRDSVFDLSLF
mgnify:FL=1